MADCKRIDQVLDRFYFCLIVFSRFAIQTRVLQSSVSNFETEASKKYFEERKKKDPASYLTVNANLQILQMLSGHSVKIHVLARVVHDKLLKDAHNKMHPCSFVTFLVEKNLGFSLQRI